MNKVNRIMNNNECYLNLFLLDESPLRELTELYESINKIKAIIDKLFKNISLKNKTILLKPNWVCHSLKDSDNLCLRTHHNFLFAALEIVLEQKPKKVIIGDAPIQGCDWDKMLGNDFCGKITEYSKYYSIPITVKDFRRVTLIKESNLVLKEKHPLSEYVIFDLAEKSFLEPISSHKPNFRVTDYDPDRLAISHSIGTHKYCLTRDLFEADVVISMPKVKTHQKVGITCALKNLVGLNGDKDFLPHHRVGGTGFGGDCYPGKNYFRRFSEFLLDNANRNIENSYYRYWITLSKIFWRLNKDSPIHNLAAGWYGNDTTWRMVLDLNIIAKYGKIDGCISSEPQRTVFSLCDGIIGGQGDGPLQPEPLPLGVVLFSNHSGLTDEALTCLMGFDISKIPLVRESKKYFPIDDAKIELNGKTIQLNDLIQNKVKTMPPRGWVGHIHYE